MEGPRESRKSCWESVVGVKVRDGVFDKGRGRTDKGRPPEAGLSVAQSCNTVLKRLRQEVGEFKVSLDCTKQNEVRRMETLEM